MRSSRRGPRPSPAGRAGHAPRSDREVGATDDSRRATATGGNSCGDSIRAVLRSGDDRGRTCRPEPRATSRETSRRPARRRRARRNTHAPARVSSTENALPGDEGREYRQHALAAPALWLEGEPPEPFEADRVDEAGWQPHAPGELVENAADPDGGPNGWKESKIPRDPTLLRGHAV